MSPVLVCACVLVCAVLVRADPDPTLKQVHMVSVLCCSAQLWTRHVLAHRYTATATARPSKKYLPSQMSSGPTASASSQMYVHCTLLVF